MRDVGLGSSLAIADAFALARRKAQQDGAPIVGIFGPLQARGDSLLDRMAADLGARGGGALALSSCPALFV